MAKRCVLGVLVSNRVQHIPDVQKVLTECGCNIRTRLGLHDTDANFCSPSGLSFWSFTGTTRPTTTWRSGLPRSRGFRSRRWSSTCSGRQAEFFAPPSLARRHFPRRCRPASAAEAGHPVLCTPSSAPPRRLGGPLKAARHDSIHWCAIIGARVAPSNGKAIGATPS